MATSTPVNNLVINKLTKAQYEAIANPDPTQLYLIIDDTEYAEASDLPQPSNTTPNIDGVGNAGVSATYARGDHTHPAELPSQTGNNGKYLTTDGNTTSWSSLGTVLNYKGTKATIAALPSSGNTTGDVWIVTANNSEHAWNGSAWEELGPTIDLSGYMQKGVDYVTAGQKTNTTLGTGATAEGYETIASGSRAHAEGYSTKATGTYSHAENQLTTASGAMSHAEGNETTASGSSSHAEGQKTIANHLSQHVFGEYNIADSSDASSYHRGNYVEIVGNGTSSTRSNARTLDWSGNETLAGKLTVGADPTAAMDVTTKQYVDAIIVEPEDDENIMQLLSECGLGDPILDANLGYVIVDDNSTILMGTSDSNW